MVICLEEVDFDTVCEDWNEYKLKYGTTLKVKLALIKVVRTDNCDQFGDPVYIVNSQNIVKITNVPDKLKRKEASSRSYVG